MVHAQKLVNDQIIDFMSYIWCSNECNWANQLQCTMEKQTWAVNSLGLLWLTLCMISWSHVSPCDYTCFQFFGHLSALLGWPWHILGGRLGWYCFLRDVFSAFRSLSSLWSPVLSMLVVEVSLTGETLYLSFTYARLMVSSVADATSLMPRLAWLANNAFISLALT